MKQYFNSVETWFRNKPTEDIKSCILCGEEGIDTHEGSDGVHMSCPKCNFLWRAKQPTQEVLDEFYGESSPMKRWAEIKSSGKDDHRQKVKFAFFADKVRDYGITSLLDVGCGTGAFFDCIDSSVVKVGIEPNEDARAECSIPPYPSYEAFMESMHGKRKYGMVSMFGVLEHVKDPRSTIEKYTKHIETGGYLGIVVPNVMSLVIKVLQLKCCTFCPQHLWFFSIPTLDHLMMEYGFELDVWATPEPELQPILRYLRGIHPYMNIEIELTDPDITETKILKTMQGYKIAALFKKVK